MITQPQVAGVTAGQRTFNVVDAMSEGQLAICRHLQIAYVIFDVATICGEGFLPGPSAALPARRLRIR